LFYVELMLSFSNPLYIDTARYQLLGTPFGDLLGT
jgi:hypothetical protein